MRTATSKLVQQRISRLYNKVGELMTLGKIKEAKANCRKILKINSKDCYANRMFGMMLKHEKKYTEALEYFSLAYLEGLPEADLLEIGIEQVDCLRALKKHLRVIKKLDFLLVKHPFEVRLHYLKGKTLDILGEQQASLECYKQAVNFPAPNTDVHQNFKAYAHFYLATAPKLKPIKSDLELIDQALNNSDNSHRNTLLLFAKAHINERLQAYKEAMNCFTAANTLAQSLDYLDYNALLQDYYKQTEISWANFDSHKAIQNESYQPIFIEGLPRSGTTLVESIISQDQSTTPCGESPFTIQALKDSAEINNLKFREAIENISPKVLDKFKESYLKQLTDEFSTTGKFTDKMVNTYEYIGIKALAFPRAKFIYVYKNSLDAAFSMYRQSFSDNMHSYSYQPKTCVFMVKLSQMYMHYWKSIFPERIYFFSFEEAVKNGDPEWCKLFQWLDLEWFSDYLDSYQNKAEVNTISAAQVREKITTRFINRSERYGDLLKEFNSYQHMSIDELLKDINNS